MNLNWSGVNLEFAYSDKFVHSAHCLPDEDKKSKSSSECCGDYPSRYPFNRDFNRSCCGGRTFNPIQYDCCDQKNSQVKLKGSC